MPDAPTPFTVRCWSAPTDDQLDDISEWVKRNIGVLTDEDLPMQTMISGVPIFVEVTHA